MTLYHTSPVEIKEITNEGLFGCGLFFSDHIYNMTGSSEVYVYSIEENDNEILDRSSIFFQEFNKEANEILEVARMDFSDYPLESDIEDYIDGSKSIWDLDIEVNELPSLDWQLQDIAGKIAFALGYKACSMPDESGTSYLVDAKNIELQLLRKRALL